MVARPCSRPSLKRRREWTRLGVDLILRFVFSPSEMSHGGQSWADPKENAGAGRCAKADAAWGGGNAT